MVLTPRKRTTCTAVCVTESEREREREREREKDCWQLHDNGPFIVRICIGHFPLSQSDILCLNGERRYLDPKEQGEWVVHC